MITKGIVEDVSNPYYVKVRMPIYDSIEGSRDSTLNKDLNYAAICSIPNTSNVVNKGDIVFIGFEDDDIGKPIIIGHLIKESGNSTLNNLNINMLTTNSLTKLDDNTYIGSVNPSEIKMLVGLRANIQQQIDYLQEQINILNGDKK